MSEKSHVERLLSLEEDWFAMFLRYGLYVVGVFQLGCIFASIFLSGSDGAEEITSQLRDREGQNDDNLNASKRLFHRTRKQEKKKRR